jgi:hypothetical protein
MTFSTTALGITVKNAPLGYKVYLMMMIIISACFIMLSVIMLIVNFLGAVILNVM